MQSRSVVVPLSVVTGGRDQPIAVTVMPDGLADMGAQVRMRRGTPLIFEGESARDCCVIERGIVMVYHNTMHGRRHVLDFLRPGDLLGFWDGETYTASADAVTDGAAIRMPCNRLQRAAYTDPLIASWTQKAAARQLEASHRRSTVLCCRSALVRISWFLLSYGGPSNNGVLILPMRRRDIADYLGVTVETVSRSFTALREAGVIDLPQHDVVVLRDRRCLERLADARTAFPRTRCGHRG